MLKRFVLGLALSLLSTTAVLAGYAPLTYTFQTQGVVAQFALVKVSTVANRVIVMSAGDPGGIVVGVAQQASAGTGGTITVQSMRGLKSSVISDGTGAIAAGDLVMPSTTVAGRVMKDPSSPTPSSNTICSALTAAAATPGALFTCLCGDSL